MERLEEINERLNKATLGPWEYSDCACEIWSTAHKTVTDDDVVIGGTEGAGIAISEDDNNFVCHAPNDIKYLLEQITALQEENERLKRENEQLKEEAFRYKSSWELESDWHKCWIKTSEKLQSECAALTKTLDKINNIAVEFQETGPHEPEKALELVMKIYRLSSLGKEAGR
jgi:predicted RNase H-like nuclease (RuvC/YqgF family)